MRGRAGSGLGPHGHRGAERVATAETRGAAGSGGRGEPPRGLGVRKGKAAALGGASGLESPGVLLGRRPGRRGRRTPAGAERGGRGLGGRGAPPAAHAQRCGPGCPGALEIQGLSNARRVPCKVSGTQCLSQGVSCILLAALRKSRLHVLAPAGCHESRYACPLLQESRVRGDW